jgi:hypothetical protein
MDDSKTVKLTEWNNNLAPIVKKWVRQTDARIDALEKRIEELEKNKEE